MLDYFCSMAGNPDLCGSRSRVYCGRFSGSVYFVLETERAGRWVADFRDLLWSAMSRRSRVSA
jgi:hypothetical protein